MATIGRSGPALPTSVSNRIALHDSRLDLARALAFGHLTRQAEWARTHSPPESESQP